MEKDNLNFTASSDDLSVEAILAEYEAENGIIKRGVEMPPQEPSRPINMDVAENDTIGTAEVGSLSTVHGLDGASKSAEKTPLSDLLRRLESERGVSQRPEDTAERGGPITGGGKPAVSIEEIMLMSDIEEITNAGAPSAGGENISDRPEKPSTAETEPQIPTDTAIEDKTEATSPTMRQIFSEDSESTPTETLFGAGETSGPPAVDGRTSASEINDAADGTEYAEDGEYDSDAYGDERTDPNKPDLREKLLTPLIAVMAYSAAKREKRRAEARAKREAISKEEYPELAPDKAAMLYAQQSASLKFRCIFASVLTLILVYLSYGLPAAGLLGKSPTVLALVCMILELTVMLIGLDIFTNGMTSLMRGKPGAESLISVSAIVSMIDAVYIALTGNTKLGIPFCGVSALSMTFALWGSKMSCESFAISFFIASSAEDPTVILSESGIDEEGCALAKSKRPVTGFVRNAESADVFENAYKLFAPVLIAGSLILSLFCYLVSESCSSFIHTFGASISICASLSSFLGFALPFSVTARRLARSRVAIAGYGGCAELGRIRRIVITDNDVFPSRTISIADISIAEGTSPQKVISYTGSMISAAGMGAAPVFTQLMRKNGCAMQKVEDFACHEGGGILARINGDHVYVGTAAFMRLMGVRLPKNATSKTAVYTAINDTLAGFFSMNYTAVASVQRALVTLLSGNNDPIFAIRDFNVTPLLLKQKFRLPTGVYDFPSFADRYRMSSPEYEEKGTVAAMYSRGGLGAVAGLSKRGRKLYIALRICSVLSVLGSVIGVVLILALCWGGAYDSASCGNIMTYMLLWLVPLFVISYGLRN